MYNIYLLFILAFFVVVMAASQNNNVPTNIAIYNRRTWK